MEVNPEKITDSPQDQAGRAEFETANVSSQETSLKGLYQKVLLLIGLSFYEDSFSK